MAIGALSMPRSVAIAGASSACPALDSRDAARSGGSASTTASAGMLALRPRMRQQEPACCSPCTGLRSRTSAPRRSRVCSAGPANSCVRSRRGISMSAANASPASESRSTLSRSCAEACSGSTLSAARQRGRQSLRTMSAEAPANRALAGASSPALQPRRRQRSTKPIAWRRSGQPSCSAPSRPARRCSGAGHRRARSTKPSG